VACLEVVADGIVLPREVMGPADVTFMGAIGAFLGWPAVLFCLAVSAMLGSVVGGMAIVFKKQDWSSRIPYGPYIALAAVLWIFGGYQWMRALLP
jgi:leader peptidase (prepilin peptidase)/N-methyltransferase